MTRKHVIAIYLKYQRLQVYLESLALKIDFPPPHHIYTINENKIEA